MATDGLTADQKANRLLNGFDEYQKALLGVHLARYHNAEMPSQKRVEAALLKAEGCRMGLFAAISELLAEGEDDD